MILRIVYPGCVSYWRCCSSCLDKLIKHGKQSVGVLNDCLHLLLRVSARQLKSTWLATVWAHLGEALKEQAAMHLSYGSYICASAGVSASQMPHSNIWIWTSRFQHNTQTKTVLTVTWMLLLLRLNTRLHPSDFVQPVRNSFLFHVRLEDRRFSISKRDFILILYDKGRLRRVHVL